MNSLIVKQNAPVSPLVLHWPPSLQDEAFFDFCQINNELRIERTVLGDCEIMAPTGGITGWRNLSLAAQLYIWTEKEGSGVAFDSSTGFILPNGATRSPDVSWVKKSRLATLTAHQKRRFLPLCPDFVIELRSPSDNLQTLLAKMTEYQHNGASLGWLLDCEARQVWVFQAEKSPVCLESPPFLVADELLTGFRLEMRALWEVGF